MAFVHIVSFRILHNHILPPKQRQGFVHKKIPKVKKKVDILLFLNSSRRTQMIRLSDFLSFDERMDMELVGQEEDRISMQRDIHVSIQRDDDPFSMQQDDPISMLQDVTISMLQDGKISMLQDGTISLLEDDTIAMLDPEEDLWNELGDTYDVSSSCTKSLDASNWNFDDVEPFLNVAEMSELEKTMRSNNSVKRRLKESERLAKFGWERIKDDSCPHKRRRYRYVNSAKGETVCSLREAFVRCKAEHMAVL